MRRKTLLLFSCWFHTLHLSAFPYLASATETLSFGAGANQFSLEFVHVGNAGNAPDTSGRPSIVGAVPYEFGIGKYEVNRGMISKANAASVIDGTGGSLGIDLGELQWIGGDDGNTDGKPATGLSWNMSARFVNWLNVDAGFPPAYRFITQPADADYDVNENVLAWDESEPGFDTENPIRNAMARFVLPSLDEWYKAAYHDSTAGVSAAYFDFATGSDVAPTPTSSGTSKGTAVYVQDDDKGPAPVEFAGGLSSYETVGQSGNVWEVQESSPRAQPLGTIWYRGGVWTAPDPTSLSSNSRHGRSPNVRSTKFGLRVAMVPDLRNYSLFGDFNDDEIISPSDLDLLSGQVRLGITTEEFDLNEDGVVDDLDRALWIERAALTVPGDTNLNRKVDFADFLKLSHHFGEVGTWATGDFDGNGHVDFPDFLLLKDTYQRSQIVSAVPEPDTRFLVSCLILTATTCRVVSRPVTG